MRTRPGDVLVLIFAAAVTFFFFRYAYGAGGGEARLVIQEESQTLVYPLNAAREISVSGVLGETRVVIQNGEAFVAASPCRDKLCLSMGRVSEKGGWIACLPNRVFIRVESGAPAEVLDAAAY